MSVELGIIIFAFVIIMILLTYKTRKNYHQQKSTNIVNVFFHNEQIGINENKELKKIGYWQKYSNKHYDIDTTFKIDDIKEIIKKELNITENDFDIRTPSDVWVPHN